MKTGKCSSRSLFASHATKKKPLLKHLKSSIKPNSFAWLHLNCNNKIIYEASNLIPFSTTTQNESDNRDGPLSKIKNEMSLSNQSFLTILISAKTWPIFWLPNLSVWSKTFLGVCWNPAEKIASQLIRLWRFVGSSKRFYTLIPQYSISTMI